MQIAQKGRAVQPAMHQRPADDQRQPEAGDGHPQAEQHENTAQHLGQTQPPYGGMRQRNLAVRMRQRLEAGDERHAPPSETPKEERPVDSCFGGGPKIK